MPHHKEGLAGKPWHFDAADTLFPDKQTISPAKRGQSSCLADHKDQTSIMNRVCPDIANALNRGAWAEGRHSVRPQQFTIIRVEICHLAAGPGNNQTAIGVGWRRCTEHDCLAGKTNTVPDAFAIFQQVNVEIAIKISDNHSLILNHRWAGTQRQFTGNTP